MSLKTQTDLLQAEIISYRKCFTALNAMFQRLEQGKYGKIDLRALEAIGEELNSVRNIALRYDVLLGRVKKVKQEDLESRASLS